MFERLIATPNDHTLTILRVTLGLVIAAHAAQKVFGWFGGAGLQGTVNIFSDVYGIPPLLAAIAIVVEVVSTVGIITGVLSRLAALGVIVIMIGAIVTVVGPNGFFMNWFGQMDAGLEGYEYHLLAIAMGIAVLVRGGGALSVDRMISGRSTGR
jgi:putative oxidoreductase